MKSLNKLTNSKCYMINDSYNHDNSFLIDSRNNSYDYNNLQFVDVTWLIDVSHVSIFSHKTSNSCKSNLMIKSKKKSKPRNSKYSHKCANPHLSEVIWHLKDRANDLLFLDSKSIIY